MDRARARGEALALREQLVDADHFAGVLAAVELRVAWRDHPEPEREAPRAEVDAAERLCAPAQEVNALLVGELDEMSAGVEAETHALAAALHLVLRFAQERGESPRVDERSEEHTSELQSPYVIS